jgi:hypothetical protein
MAAFAQVANSFVWICPSENSCLAGLPLTTALRTPMPNYSPIKKFQQF